MIINIYTSLNGVGLQVDADILKSIFSKHTVYILDYIKRQKAFTQSDYGIHLEIPRYEDFAKNRVNILIPNPEWFEVRWMPQIKKFDYIFCKTNYTQELFSKHGNTVYTGFTSIDYYNPAIKKEKIFFHLEGQSQFKNTDILIECYKSKELPLCYSVSSRHSGKHGNLIFAPRQTGDNLQTLLNACLIHICPSMAEGFGHYINEARSTESVILTLDKPPMNEFIKDKRFLVEGIRGKNHNLVPLFKVDPLDLIKKIENIYSMPEKELIEIGKQNRIEYLKLDKEFKENLNKYIK